MRLKNVHKVRSKKGRTYYYHRPTRTRLKAEVGTPEFVREVERLNAQAEKPEIVAGTFGALFVAYRASPEFAGLADATKADYTDVIDWLSPLHDMPLAKVDSGFAIKLRDKAFAKRKRRFANYVVQVCRLAWNWGRPRKLAAAENPFSETPLIRKPRGEAKANRAWTDGERRAVLEAATGGLRVVVALGMHAAFREGDAVKFARRGYDGAAIEFVQGKTGEPVWLPAHRDLRDILDEALATFAKDHLVFAIGQRGRPFTASGFRASFFKLVHRLQAEGKVGEGLTFHGLRHTVGKLLAEAGCDTKRIAAVLGHKTTKMAEHYSAGADQRRMATEAIRRLERSDDAAQRKRDREGV